MANKPLGRTQLRKTHTKENFSLTNLISLYKIAYMEFLMKNCVNKLLICVGIVDTGSQTVLKAIIQLFVLNFGHSHLQ